MQRKNYQEQIARLKEEQDFALKDTEEQIHKWEGFMSDYEALKKRLVTLPDEVSHDVMVPFGKMAFMPGRLVHTNEILVLLGDNWFAERSAKQAIGIVDRRMKQVDKQLADLDKQRKLLEPRRDFTSDLQGLGRDDGESSFDIREEYDEEREKLWKERHKENVKKHRQKLLEDSLTTEPSVNNIKPNIDEQLWARLDELEKIENEEREMEKIGKEDAHEPEMYPWRSDQSGADKEERNFGTINRHDEVLQDVTKNRSDHVTKNSSESEGQSDVTDTSEDLDSDDEESWTEDREESDETEPVTGGNVIHFTHTVNQEGQDSNSTGDTSLLHPGVLYSKFYVNRQPRSILKKSTSEQKKVVKKKSRRRVVEFDTGSDTDEKAKTRRPVQKTPLVPAFSGTVVEKQIRTVNTTQTQGTDLQGTDIRGPSSVQTVKESEQTNNTKPVSRFKARKQNRPDS